MRMGLSKSKWIEMHVIANALEVAVAAPVHDQRFTSPAEQMTEKFVPTVKAAGVNAQKPFHPFDQVRLRRFEHQMKMIGHQAKSVNHPLRLGASLTLSKMCQYY